MAWTRLYDEAEPQRVNRWLAQNITVRVIPLERRLRQRLPAGEQLAQTPLRWNQLRGDDLR